MNFAQISGSKKANKFEGLINAFGRTAESKKKTYETDEDYWYPQRDKEGNAKALIRFLPGLEAEDEPCFVELFSHTFQGPTGKWYFNNCPSTIGRDDCPVCAANRQAVEDGSGS